MLLVVQASSLGRSERFAAAVLTAFVAVSRRFPLQIAFRRRMVTDGAPIFAAVLLLPAWLSPFVALAGVGIAEAILPVGRRD
jgi:hypothetical protein